MTQNDDFQPDFNRNCEDCKKIVEQLQRLLSSGKLPIDSDTENNTNHNSDTGDPIDDLKKYGDYDRSEIKTKFMIGGMMFGINYQSNKNRILLFSSKHEPYHDISFHKKRIYAYMGEGKIGNQELTRGNKRLYESFVDKIPVYLAWRYNGKHKYIGKVRLLQPMEVQHHDINNNLRNVYIFILKETV